MDKFGDVTAPVWSGATRPPIPDDFVHREGFKSILDAGRKYPIILVSAPAGYGKSTQISHWVEQSGTPCVWVSLENSNNDLGTFLRLLETGLKSWSTEVSTLLGKISETANLPSTNYIADAISTSMNSVGKELIFVLDDYHHVQDAVIHQFVESLLARLPNSVRIAIVTRRTPPLALSRLRSQSLVLDVRLQDLQFDRGETEALVELAAGSDVDTKILDKIQAVTEGWPTGLRMLLLALEGKKDIGAYLEKFKGQVWQIQEYLVEEVMDQLPEMISDRIYRTAVLDRFSEELIDAVLPAKGDDDPSGQQVLRFIQDKGLFCIPLDDHSEWFRYHHLFQDVLIKKCKALFSKDEIRDLNRKAAAWFDLAGDCEEAVRHCEKADDMGLAEHVIARHGRDLNQTHEAVRIERLLSLLPANVIEKNVDLLALVGWNSSRLGRITQMMEVTQLAENRVREIDANENEHGSWLGETYALRSMLLGHLGDTEKGLPLSARALELLPADYSFERTETTMVRALLLQMTGDSTAGRDLLYQAIECSGAESDPIRSRFLIGLCYLNWTNGDLHQMRRHAKSLHVNAKLSGRPYDLVHSCRFNSAALYQLNDLDAAEDFAQTVTAEKWWPHQVSYSSCVQIMSLIYAARGEHSHALALSEVLLEESLERSTTYYLPVVQALQAELAYMRGDISGATHWALNFEMGTITAGIGFAVPALLAARILIQMDSDDVQEKVDIILNAHRAFYESTFNKRFLCETLALQAMSSARSGINDDALELLDRAIKLAEASGFIRLFVDLGPGVIPLLNRLELGEQQLKYVGTILAAFPSTGKGQQVDNAAHLSQRDNPGLLEALSKRESEVLELLAQRLTNKEIGAQLFISPDTVKRHAHNIFAKLNVSSRREARAKAIGLGIVSG